jgi:cytochrome c oxidase subunit 3
MKTPDVRHEPHPQPHSLAQQATQSGPDGHGSGTSILAHHFDDLDQQHESAVLGMWTFLATEVMLFGGLFTAYAVFRMLSPWEFALASRHLSVPLGGINTAVLLVSSLTMALAVRASQLRQARSMVGLMIATMVLGTAFLGIKAVEYHREYEEKLVPGWNYQIPAEDAERLDELAENSGYPQIPERMQLFACLYFFMTGLHAIHLIIGITLVGVIAMLAWRRRETDCGAIRVEVAGLYWHFIDVVWVFLYPLLYLIDVHK